MQVNYLAFLKKTFSNFFSQNFHNRKKESFDSKNCNMFQQI